MYYILSGKNYQGNIKEGKMSFDQIHFKRFQRGIKFKRSDLWNMTMASREEMTSKKGYLIFTEHLFMLRTIKMFKYAIITTIINLTFQHLKRDSEGFHWLLTLIPLLSGKVSQYLNKNIPDSKSMFLCLWAEEIAQQN